MNVVVVGKRKIEILFGVVGLVFMLPARADLVTLNAHIAAPYSSGCDTITMPVHHGHSWHESNYI